MTSGPFAHASQHALEGGTQRGQVLFDDKPDGIQIDPQITVHDHVAKAGEFAPRHLRFGGLGLA